MDSDSRVLVAGANGMVGSAIVRNLESKGYTYIIKGTRRAVDFTDDDETDTFFRLSKPEYVFVAAAKVGGIMANNNYKADFLTENLRIQTNIIESAHRHGVKKLLFLGSSCIYPKFATQPIAEDQLMTGSLEPTNDAYAIAKISGIMMCQAYRQQHGFNAISLMPTNLYGPNDNFDLETSHVLPAMIAKFHHAKQNGYTIDMGGPWYGSVKLWGDGSAMREFLHVDDLAEACYVCMQNYDGEEHINVGTGEDVTIKELAETISKVVGFTGDIEWDITKPNGTPRKVLNVDKIKALGWEPKISLKEGINATYKWYKNSLSKINNWDEKYLRVEDYHDPDSMGFSKIYDPGVDNLYIDKIKESYQLSLNGSSNLPPWILELEGMSGLKYRHFINNLVSKIDSCRYLEVGCWKGSTFCSAAYNNNIKSFLVDNWSEFVVPELDFKNNIFRCISDSNSIIQFKFNNNDYRNINYSNIGKYNLYLYDGPHEYGHHFNHFELVLDSLDDQFIFICDDWNWEWVREETMTSINNLGLKVSFSIEIFTYGPDLFELTDWHNGYFICVCQK